MAEQLHLTFDRVWNTIGDVRSAVRFEQMCMDLLETDNLRDLPKGVIIGTVKVVDCHEVTETGFSDGSCGPAWQLRDHTWEWPSELEQALGDYTRGRYAWQLVHPVAFPHPIPTRGRQGLWEWDVPGLVTP